MANDLRFVSTLDHSNFDKGIAESTAEIRKLAEESNQASHGIKGMFDTPAMKEARANFAGVEQSVSKFVQAMSRELPMKMELRKTQAAAAELESSWRALSAEQKNSAAGQALRQNIDELIKRGGTLRDVMADVNRSMKFQASDTAKLDAMIGGIKTLTSVAQAAAGALTLMGVSQEDAAEVQKKLIAIMSVTNALQTIQNSLQKESALMMGLAAAKAAVLNATQKASVAISTALSAATSRLAAALNLSATSAKALKVALGGLALAAVAGLVYAISQALNSANDAEKRLEERQKKLNDITDKGVKVYAEAIAELQMYKREVDNFNGSQRDAAILVDELNSKYGTSLGQHKELAQWKEILATKSKALALQMMYEAQAQAALAEFSASYIKVQQLSREIAALDAQANSLNFAEKFAGVGDVLTMKIKGLRAEMEQAKKDTLDFFSLFSSKAAKAREIGREAGLGTPSTTTTTKTKTKKSGKNTTKKDASTPLSYDWYEEQIKNLEDLADKTADLEERAKLLGRADVWKWTRDVKFGEVSEDVENLRKSLQGTAIDMAKVVEGIDFTSIADRIKQPIITAKKSLDDLKSNLAATQDGIRAMASVMQSAGKIVGGSAGDWLSWSASVMQAVAQALPEIAKLFPALFGKAAAEAMAQNASMGPFGWISGIAAMASIIAAMAMLPKFATGGIVGGTSYTGDRQLVRVNSGEMILNGQQQAQLWNAISSGSLGGGEVTFKIAGQQLVGVLNNYNSKYSKVR